MTAPLHDDDPDAAEVTWSGVVRNMSAAEYEATYATGTTHALPDGVEAAVTAEAVRIAASREG